MRCGKRVGCDNPGSSPVGQRFSLIKHPKSLKVPKDIFPAYLSTNRNPADLSRASFCRPEFMTRDNNPIFPPPPLSALLIRWINFVFLFLFNWRNAPKSEISLSGLLLISPTKSALYRKIRELFPFDYFSLFEWPIYNFSKIEWYKTRWVKSPQRIAILDIIQVKLCHLGLGILLKQSNIAMK